MCPCWAIYTQVIVIVSQTFRFWCYFRFDTTITCWFPPLFHIPIKHIVSRVTFKIFRILKECRGGVRNQIIVTRVVVIRLFLI